MLMYRTHTFCMKIHEGKTLAQNNKSSKVALESSSSRGEEAYESCDRAAAFTFLWVQQQQQQRGFLEFHKSRKRAHFYVVVVVVSSLHRKLNLIARDEEFAEESMGLDTDSFFCPQRQANFGLFQAVDTFLKKSKYKKLTLSYQLKDTFEQRSHLNRIRICTF